MVGLVQITQITPICYNYYNYRFFLVLSLSTVSNAMGLKSLTQRIALAQQVHTYIVLAHTHIVMYSVVEIC